MNFKFSHASIKLIIEWGEDKVYEGEFFDENMNLVYKGMFEKKDLRKFKNNPNVILIDEKP